MVAYLTDVSEPEMRRRVHH